MQKRLIGIVLSVVGTAALAALLWRGLVAPATSAPLADAVRLPPTSGLASGKENEVAGARSDAALERLPGDVSRATSSAVDDDDVSLLVRVFDGVSEKPVPGARVHYWDARSWAARIEVPDDSPLTRSRDDEDWLLAMGQIAQCDAAGEARVIASVWTDVVAEFDGAVGLARVEDEGELRITIRPELCLAVRLLTADRQPVVGVEVGLWSLDAAGVPVCGDPLRIGSTDGLGVVRFRHLQWPIGESPALREPTACAVRPHLPGCSAVFATFSPAVPPDEPLELVLPACGQIELRWPAGVELPSIVMMREVGACWYPIVLRGVKEDPRRFEHVLVGQRYDIHAGSTSVQVDGPRAAGEVVVVQLAGETKVALTGILQDHEGRVLADRECVLHSLGSALFLAGSVRTDDAGRFEFSSYPWCRGRSFHCVIHVRAEGAGPFLVVPPVQGVLTSGGNDLGVLRAAVAEPLVTGRVVRHADGELLQPDLVVERLDAEDEQWWWVDGLSITHSRTGFVIHGHVAAQESLRLRCERGDLVVGGPRPFVPGQRDVVLEVREAVLFETRARYDAEVVPRVQVELIPLDLSAAEFASLGLEPGAPLTIRAFELQGDRAVYEDMVPAGTYDLQFRAQGFPDVLARVDRVVVGGERPDPRLLEVDLRGKLAALVVDVVDGNGAPQLARIVAFGVSDLERDRAELSSGTTLLVPAGARDLLVFWPDYPPVEVRGVKGRVRVEVAPWRSSDVVVTGLPPLPVGYSFQIDVGDQKPRDWSRYESYLSCVGQEQSLENGRARLQFGDGPAPARLRIARDSDGATQDLPPLQPDQVVAGDAPIELHAPSTEAILAALATLQARPLR